MLPFFRLKVQKDLYLFLISHFRIIKKHFVLSYDEGKGPSTGVETILPSNFVPGNILFVTSELMGPFRVGREQFRVY